MNRVKLGLIIGSICLVIGLISGLGIMYGCMKPSVIPGENISTTGDTEKVVIKEVIVYRDRVKIKVVAKEGGAIESTIPKTTLCPELLRKNILSLGISPYYVSRDFYLGYNLDYQHIFKSRFILGTGLSLHHNLVSNKIDGFGSKLSMGILF